MGTGRRLVGTVMAVAVPVLLAACDGGPTEPEGGGADVVLAVLNMSMARHPASLEGPGTWEYACPSGGRFVVEGEMSFGQEGDVSIHTWDQLMTYEDCAMSLEGSEAVANGEMHIEGEARFGPPVDGRAPILMQESSQVGTMTTSYRGETRTCAYDLTHVYVPADEEYRISGTACGRSVDLRAPLMP